ncbi:lamin tail domain-containing protein [Anaerolineales bacterium HSG25]|nr:lamin tail domain-containing protein [Anaerolineales bacterium HSG25]
MKIIPPQSHTLFFGLMIVSCLLVGLAYQSLATVTQPLVINEIVASNRTNLIDEDGDHSDWIEIYNPTSKPINLSGWSLTNDVKQSAKWTFPATIIESHSYLILFASGKDRITSPNLHTNFKLKKTGGELFLFEPSVRRFTNVIQVPYPAQFSDIAYGRIKTPPSRPVNSSDSIGQFNFDQQLSSHSYNYLTHPTPGLPNDRSSAWLGDAAQIQFSVSRGVYETPFWLNLHADLPQTIIRYTVDGSQPTESNSLIYTEPISINSTSLIRAIATRPGFHPSTANTHSYIFPQTVLEQPANPTGWPKYWGDYDNDVLDYQQGEPVLADYEMDSEIVNQPTYREQLIQSFQQLPSVSIVTDQANYGIYIHAQERGLDWERPVSVELIQTDGRLGFQINAGIRMQGGAGRRDVVPKHSFRLFFRRRYGAGKLNYPLFPDSPVKEFNTLILRGGVNRNFAGKPRYRVPNYHRLTTYTRDEWMRRSQIEMSGSGARGIFVHLYLNGLYWGLYNLVERPDTDFSAAHFGGRAEDWFAINHSGPISGDGERAETLQKLAQEGDLPNPVKYAQIKRYLDTTQFIDYLILNWYAGNRDWGGNNWYAGVYSPTGRVKYFMWDGEKTWIDGAQIVWIKTDSSLPDQPNLFKPFFEGLMYNTDFKMELADRIYRNMFNDGPLTTAQAQTRWLALTDQVEPAIVAELARWGDVRYAQPITLIDWQQARDQVLAQMSDNVTRFIDLVRQAGYYPTIAPPTFNQHGGQIGDGFQLVMSIPDSTQPNDSRIIYTLDGTDPRQLGEGNIAPQAKIYDQPITLTQTTVVKSRLWADGIWSALNEAQFFVEPTLTSSLQISELMYHPLTEERYEFIELQNIGQAEANLANLSFEGVDFTFPPDTPPLAAGAFVILVRDANSFAERYPHVTIDGVYQGGLSNQGERISLMDQTGVTLFSVTYHDRNGWPLSADGGGDSLVLVDRTGNPNNPANWGVSADLHGSPREQ